MAAQRIVKIAISGILIAIGIIIPMFSPIKIVLEPASFTLASHVCIFIAMFISPYMSLAVSLGTALGFFFGGFPVVIVIRAASHIFFAFAGSMYLHRVLNDSLSALKVRVFSLLIALIHAFGELVVVSVFYFSGSLSSTYAEQGFIVSVLLLVGLGTVVHSMVDFEIARALAMLLKKQRSLTQYFGKVS